MRIVTVARCNHSLVNFWRQFSNASSFSRASRDMASAAIAYKRDTRFSLAFNFRLFDCGTQQAVHGSRKFPTTVAQPNAVATPARRAARLRIAQRILPPGGTTIQSPAASCGRRVINKRGAGSAGSPFSGERSLFQLCPIPGSERKNPITPLVGRALFPSNVEMAPWHNQE